MKNDQTNQTAQATYQLTCTESQLRLIQTALERYFRLGMGQFWDYCDDLCFAGFDYTAPQDEVRADEFNHCIDRRDLAMEQFETAYKQAVGPGIRRKTPDEQRAIDIYQTIRHQLWLDKPEPKNHLLVDSDPPLNLSGEKLVEVRRVKDG